MVIGTLLWHHSDVPFMQREKVIDKVFVSCCATTAGPQVMKRLLFLNLFFLPPKTLVFCGHDIMNVISAEARPYQPTEHIIKSLTSPSTRPHILPVLFSN